MQNKVEAAAHIVQFARSFNNMKRLLTFFIAIATFGADISVPTSQYDIARTGTNSSETVFTAANVSGIHKLGSFTIDGYMYAQPLIVSGVSIGGASSVMIATTMNNSIYLFNAKAPGSAYIWRRNFGATLTTHPAQADNFLYQQPVGCMATPTIDTVTAMIYATCPTSAGDWKIYKLNLADGTDAVSPVTISGTNNGLTFDPIRHLVRVALGIVGNNVHLFFTGWGDESPYQGWIFTYNKTTLVQVAAKSLEDATTGLAGFWSSGGGAASDGTSLFMISGNGTYNGTTNFADSLLRINNTTLAIEDWSTPANQTTISAQDKDIAAGKLIYIAPGYVTVIGKDGRLFVADAADMGHQEGVGAGPRQLFLAQNGGVFGCTIFAMNRIIFSGNNTTLKGFFWNPSTHLFSIVADLVGGGPYGNPGPGCSFSWNGSDTSSGILWGVTPAASAFSTIQDGTLRAWSGNSLGELYNSGSSASDTLGKYAKFAMPTVANGLVYVPTFSNTVVVYGFAIPSGTVSAGRTASGGRTTQK